MEPTDTATCQRLSRRFVSSSGSVEALVDIEIAVKTGHLVAIAGPSGSGKSTLLNMFACVDRPDDGEVWLGTSEVTRLSRKARRLIRRHRLGIVLPQPSDNLLEGLDAVSNVRRSFSLRGTAADPALDSWFDLVDLDGCQHKGVRELSGGEQQRVALLCAIAGPPELVLCDEPTASLDQRSASTVIGALRAVTNSGTTCLVATHDQALIEASDLVVFLDHGRVT